MKLWKENTKMPLGFDLLFKERHLETEIILFSKKPSHAAIIIFNSTDRGVRGSHVCDIEPPLLKGLFRPFASPVSVVIFCGLPWYVGWGVFIGMTVSCCFLCLPPLDQFIPNAQSASSPRKSYVDDWSKIKSATHPGCRSSKIEIALATCVSNCLWSHYGSPFAHEYVMHYASLSIMPS
jgi:hypothetical protein